MEKKSTLFAQLRDLLLSTNGQTALENLYSKAQISYTRSVIFKAKALIFGDRYFVVAQGESVLLHCDYCGFQL